MPTVSDLDGWGARLAALIDELPEEGMEEAAILDALSAAADAYEDAIVAKVDGIVHVLQVLEDRESIARRDKARAEAAIRYHRRQTQRVRALARYLMGTYERTTGARKVATTYATVSLQRRREYTYPDDLDSWPEAWLEVETRTKPVRDRARAAIDAGTAPEGFGAADVDGLQVRGRS